MENTKYQTKVKIKKGDEVYVLTGKSRGTTGTVENVDRKHLRVTVTGANLYKRHTKPSMQSPDGGIIEQAMSMHISNVAILDPKSKKPSRVGFRMEGDKKVRIAKKSGAALS